MLDGESVGTGDHRSPEPDALGDLATRPDFPDVGRNGTSGPTVEPLEMARVTSNPLARALRRWIGINESLLDQVPGDRTYFTFAVVLATFVAAIDGVGLGVLLTMTVGASSRALPIGVGVGFMFYILFLDLSILTPEPYDEVADVNGKKLRARRKRSLTRLAVAILLGFFVALGLTAAVFAQDVNRRAALERTAQIESATKRLRTEQADVQTQALAKPSAEVKAAQQAETQANDDVNRLTLALAGQRAQCNDEINGTGGSGLVGQGPRADLKCAEATQLSAQVDTANQRLVTAEAGVAAAVKTQTSQAASTASAVSDIKIPKPFKPNDLGPIDRIAATHQALGNWEILVALVLIAIDCAPVLLKQTKGVTDYERLLGMHHARMVEDPRAEAQRRRNGTDAELRIDGALSTAYTDGVLDSGVESMRRIAAERVRANEAAVVSRLWNDQPEQPGDGPGTPIVDVRRGDDSRADGVGPNRPMPTGEPVAASATTEADGTTPELSEEDEAEAARRAAEDPAWLAKALTYAMQTGRSGKAG